jgi:hypothetical protein
MRRTITTLTLAIATALVLAVPALAHDNGEGLVGETDDKIITFFCLGVLVFFVAVTIIGSTAQAALEKRKNAKKAARLRGRTGW